jgi:ankyrin repeat protein
MLAAASNHDPRVIPLFLSAGADINARNRSGESALIFAVMFRAITRYVESHPGLGNKRV